MALPQAQALLRTECPGPHPCLRASPEYAFAPALPAYDGAPGRRRHWHLLLELQSGPLDQTDCRAPPCTAWRSGAC